MVEEDLNKGASMSPSFQLPQPVSNLVLEFGLNEIEGAIASFETDKKKRELNRTERAYEIDSYGSDTRSLTHPSNNTDTPSHNPKKMHLGRSKGSKDPNNSSAALRHHQHEMASPGKKTGFELA